MKSIAAFSRLFDPRGRLSRQAYARLVVRLAVVAMALVCFIIVAAAQGYHILAMAACGTLLLFCFSGLTQTIRRLHDRRRTGWWIMLPVVQSGLSFVPVETQVDAYPVAVSAYALAMLAAGLWFTIEVLGRPGLSSSLTGHDGDAEARSLRIPTGKP